MNPQCLCGRGCICSKVWRWVHAEVFCVNMQRCTDLNINTLFIYHLDGSGSLPDVGARCVRAQRVSLLVLTKCASAVLGVSRWRRLAFAVFQSWFFPRPPEIRWFHTHTQETNLRWTSPDFAAGLGIFIECFGVRFDGWAWCSSRAAVCVARKYSDAYYNISIGWNIDSITNLKNQIGYWLNKSILVCLNSLRELFDLFACRTIFLRVRSFVLLNILKLGY